MSRTVLGLWQVLFFAFSFLKELRKVSPDRVAGVSVGKAAGRQDLCSPKVQLVKRGEGLAELWDDRCPPVGVSGLREVRVWSDEGERPAPWIAPGFHTASLCWSLVGGWAGQGPGPSPASPGGSASSTAPGLGHRPASTVLRPSPFSLVTCTWLPPQLPVLCLAQRPHPQAHSPGCLVQQVPASGFCSRQVEAGTRGVPPRAALPSRC